MVNPKSYTKVSTFTKIVEDNTKIGNMCMGPIEE